MYSFGWKPDLPDHRDFKYSAIMPVDFALPARVDLRENLSTVEDQGHLSSCVAHATVGALEFLELQALKSKLIAPEVFDKTAFSDLSRMFIYCNARILDGTLNQDAGTQIRSAIRALIRWGICRESTVPYDPNAVFHYPPIAGYREAHSHLVSTAYRLDNSVLTQLKTCLVAGYPFLFGMAVYESMMSHEVLQTGIVPYPGQSERPMGGHALCCVGYDDVLNKFIVRNSWSARWGDKGYCYIPYDYLTNLDLAADFWTIRNQP